LDDGSAQVTGQVIPADARLVGLGALAIRLQDVIPGILMAPTVILTVIFAFGVFHPGGSDPIGRCNAGGCGKATRILRLTAWHKPLNKEKESLF
jgi:hypothetical protein